MSNESKTYYKSVNTLNKDIWKFCNKIPENVDFVTGVPKTGTIVSILISKYTGLSYGIGNRTLMVDDSVLTGKTIGAAKRIYKPRITGAIYVKPGSESLIDLYQEVLPSPRIFEWNLFCHPKLIKCCMDIDGVLCRDPEKREDYEMFINTVKPDVIPSAVIGNLVTCRLEQYRKQTVSWLLKNGVKYKSLYMRPSNEIYHSTFKADIYKRKASVKNKTRALLFIESSVKQAKEIAKITGRSVLCWETRELAND